MNQIVEPNPYPSLSVTIIFFLKFLLGTSFILAILYHITNYSTIAGYAGEFNSFLIESIVAYVITLVLVVIGSFILKQLSPSFFNVLEDKKNDFGVKSFMVLGFLSFLLLGFYQYLYQISNYPLLQDPFPLTGFAWSAVLFWWIVSLALGVWGISAIIYDIMVKRAKK